MSDNWTSKAFSILGHVCDFWLLGDDPEGQVRTKMDLGFTVEHWLGNRASSGGDDGQHRYFRTRHGSAGDKLGPYVEAAKRLGLRVIVYLNVHWYNDQFPADMFTVKADGSRVTAYGSGSLACPNGPFLQHCIDLAEDLGQYAIDGVFLDGPIVSACWCPSCRKTYRERTGEEMPPERMDLRQRRLMEEHSAWKVGRFVQAFRDTLRCKQPGAIVYHNGNTLGSLTWANRAVIEHADWLGIEGGFIGYEPLEPQFLYKTAATGKLLACLAGGKPGVIFNDHAFKKYDYSPLPRPELDLLWAATLATGANPWYLSYASNFGTHAGAVARDWNAFMSRHNDDLSGTAAAETVGLLWSDSTYLAARTAKAAEDSVHDAAGMHTSLARPLKGDHRAAIEGAYAMLARSAIPFGIVTEHDLAAGLGDLKVLIAPAVAVLDEASLAGIEQFVRRGGVLIADDEFAVMDELGGLRDGERLAGLLGARLGEPIAAAATNIDYFAMASNALGKALRQYPLPRPTRAWKVELSGGKALAKFYQPLKGRYDDLPPVSDCPAIVEHAVGEGCVFYLPMNMMEHYAAFSFDEHRAIVAGLLQRHHRPIVQVDGLDGLGEALVRRKGGKTIVHLLNYNGNVRPFAKITPIKGVRVTLRGAPAGVKARALHLGKDLPVRQTKDGAKVRLPSLGGAEMIVFE